VDLVDPRHARVDVARGAVDLAHVVRPDRRAQAVLRLVRAADRLVEVRVAEDRKHRAEDLLAHEPRVLPRLGDDRGLDEPALVARPGPAADQHLAAFRDAVLDLRDELVAAGACVDRPHPQLWLFGLHGPVARLVAPDALDELPDEGVVDRVVDEHALAAQARLPGVPVAADDDRLDRGVDVGVVAHDHRVRAAELERQPLHRGRRDRGHAAADLGRARERDAPHVGMADERVADDRAVAGHDVQHAVRHARLGEDARDLERRERRRRGRLGDDRVAAGQRRRDLRAEQRQREVVRRDRGADAHRAAHDLTVGGAERGRQLLVGAAHLRRRLGVVADPVREVRDLARRLHERLALLRGQHAGEVLRALLDERRCLREDRRAVLGVGRRPLGERALRRLDGEVDVGGVAARDARDDVLGRRVDDLDLLVRAGLAPLPADQHGRFHGAPLVVMFP
jgi:ParB family chromosome partitioning protein